MQILVQMIWNLKFSNSNNFPHDIDASGLRNNTLGN